ncbi:hypothetical protein CFP56_032284 [Quercus suber]|uniref:Uncharacterized protein n=1 Tax=Quercus suber TaxID=58331 RepID=A0AAW0LTH3_QUESU
MARSKVEEEEEIERLVMGTTKVVTSNIKKKLNINLNLNVLKMKHMHNNKTKASEFSPTPLKPTFTCFPHTVKISFGGGAMVLSNKTKLKKVTSNIKKKLNINLNLNVLKMKHMHNNKTKASEFSPTPLKPTFTCFPHTVKRKKL